MVTNSSHRPSAQVPKTTGRKISLAISHHFQNLATRVRWSHSPAQMDSFPIIISQISASRRLVASRTLVGSNPLLASPALVIHPLVASRGTVTHSRLVVSHSLVNRVSASSPRLITSRAMVGSNSLAATSTSQVSVVNNLSIITLALAK